MINMTFSNSYIIISYFEASKFVLMLKRLNGSGVFHFTEYKMANE